MSRFVVILVLSFLLLMRSSAPLGTLAAAGSSVGCKPGMAVIATEKRDSLLLDRSAAYRRLLHNDNPTGKNPGKVHDPPVSGTRYNGD
ncbi:hypothetical protein PVAP13_1NG113500 [Panicum virgatum]|uniref:Uncharacterized protein n=1 Tax=Panicum virgatum TaxID=38727 RepID=A0A8T0WWG5_PANVG|nr:hypothetical protein PVAP13_1NG113500 [Panicum virgatum]